MKTTLNVKLKGFDVTRQQEEKKKATIQPGAYYERVYPLMAITRTDRDRERVEKTEGREKPSSAQTMDSNV